MSSGNTSLSANKTDESDEMTYVIVIIPTDKEDWDFANVTLSAPVYDGSSSSRTENFMISNPIIYKKRSTNNMDAAE